MPKIKIKNFGPIKEGFLENDGWLDINKVTLFIGNQGSGKSTVAKLISTFSWIEKAMVKGILHQDELNLYNRFLKQLAYQRLNNYAQLNTEIEYRGRAFTYSFRAGIFSAYKSDENGYLLPKIMYVPAERNFLSVVDRPDKLKNLPSSLYTFLDEYDEARNLFYAGLELPFSGVRFSYDKLNKIAHVVDDTHSIKLRLSEASSGFQSTVPLYIVSKYLAEGLNREQDASIKENSIEEQRKTDKEVKQIMEDKGLTPEVRQAILRQLSAKRQPVCFINIVEEPEQNLFPTSQWQLVKKLLEFNNYNAGNHLIITTHSPYLINFMSIAIQADILKNKIIGDGDNSLAFDKLSKVINPKSTVGNGDTRIYQLDEQLGTIILLPSSHGIPSDQNYLNKSLRHGNEMFDSLLEIEQEL